MKNRLAETPAGRPELEAVRSEGMSPALAPSGARNSSTLSSETPAAGGGEIIVRPGTFRVNLIGTRRLYYDRVTLWR